MNDETTLATTTTTIPALVPKKKPGRKPANGVSAATPTERWRKFNEAKRAREQDEARKEEKRRENLERDRNRKRIKRAADREAMSANKNNPAAQGPPVEVRSQLAKMRATNNLAIEKISSKVAPKDAEKIDNARRETQAVDMALLACQDPVFFDNFARAWNLLADPRASLPALADGSRALRSRETADRIDNIRRETRAIDMAVLESENPGFLDNFARASNVVALADPRGQHGGL